MATYKARAKLLYKDLRSYREGKYIAEFKEVPVGFNDAELGDPDKSRLTERTRAWLNAEFEGDYEVYVSFLL